MYTLTEVSVANDNVVFHQQLGERFSVIDREVSKKEFERTYNAMYGNSESIEFNDENINKDVYCLVVSEGGKSIFGLTKNNFYYIVTESGKTFKNLSYKN